MEGSIVTSTTVSPLKVQTKRLMIERGIVLPSPSRRIPLSMGWLIKVRTETTSPAEASRGARTRGVTFSAIFLTLCLLAATAADGDFYVGNRLGKAAIGHFRNGDHILLACETDTGCGSLRPSHWAEFECRNIRVRIACRENDDLLGTWCADFDLHGVAVLGNFWCDQGDARVRCGRPARVGGDSLICTFGQ